MSMNESTRRAWDQTGSGRERANRGEGRGIFMAGPETKMTKKSWSEPELIVLVRGQPEEAILSTCKSAQVTGTSPDVAVSGCTGSGFCAIGTAS